jgi:hypothetical protein
MVAILVALFESIFQDNDPFRLKSPYSSGISLSAVVLAHKWQK